MRLVGGHHARCCPYPLPLVSCLSRSNKLRHIVATAHDESALQRLGAQGQSENSGERGRPRPGKPEGIWPTLDQIASDSGIEREAPSPIPSTMRSKKNSGKPWDRHSPRGDAEDQTHHFAAYFSLGINGRPFSELLAETLDRSGGEPDRLLGANSYVVGEDLRRDPSRLRSVGNRIRGAICQ